MTLCHYILKTYNTTRTFTMSTQSNKNAKIRSSKCTVDQNSKATIEKATTIPFEPIHIPRLSYTRPIYELAARCTHGILTVIKFHKSRSPIRPTPLRARKL